MLTTANKLSKSFELIESMAAAVDHFALSAGQLSLSPAPFQLPGATWRSILRSRRLRVFDWTVDAGFRLLNLLPNSSELFLSFAEQNELHNKYGVARRFWPIMRQAAFQDELSEHNAWLDAIAQTEILLVELHEPHPDVITPEADNDAVALAPGVRLVEIDPAALELHFSIPEFSLPAPSAATQFSALLRNLPAQSPVKQNALFVPPTGAISVGSLVQIDPQLSSALRAMAQQPSTVALLRSQIGNEFLDGLLQLGALSKCQC